jgi:hypothetical protein
MKAAFHALLIAVVFLGGDLVMNDGAETQRLMRGANVQSLWNRAKLQNYNVTASIRRDIYSARPQLTLAKIDD